jgi:hypothetical protein
MSYTVRLYWNETLCLEGKGTSVCCHDVAYNHIAGNFAGREVKDYLAAHASFQALLDKEVLRLAFGGPSHGGYAVALVMKD